MVNEQHIFWHNVSWLRFIKYTCSSYIEWWVLVVRCFIVRTAQHFGSRCDIFDAWAWSCSRSRQRRTNSLSNGKMTNRCHFVLIKIIIFHTQLQTYGCLHAGKSCTSPALNGLWAHWLIWSADKKSPDLSQNLLSHGVTEQVCCTCNGKEDFRGLKKHPQQRCQHLGYYAVWFLNALQHNFSEPFLQRYKRHLKTG